MRWLREALGVTSYWLSFCAICGRPGEFQYFIAASPSGWWAYSHTGGTSFCVHIHPRESDTRRSAIDLGTFEWLKRTYTKRKAKALGCDERDVQAGPFVVLGIGATSGSVGAAIVYPLNLLRTRYVCRSNYAGSLSCTNCDERRLQAQGTAAHPHTYTGLRDCFTRTYSREGAKGLFKGLTPNLLKVRPLHILESY